MPDVVDAEKLLKAAGPGVSKHLKELLKKIAGHPSADKAYHAVSSLCVLCIMLRTRSCSVVGFLTGRVAPGKG